MLANYFASDKGLQAGQKGCCSHPPTPARQDAHGTEQGRREVRDAKNNEAHGAMKKERHVCERRRDGEAGSVPRERRWRTFSTAC